jgi:hypothetical protein
MRTHKRHRAHRGAAPVDVVMCIATFVVLAWMLYFTAVNGFVNLYQIIAIHTGSPYA